MERVTFHNPENGFCVLRVKVRGQSDLVTVVGAAATITAGEFVQASGYWVNDRTHGVQFKAAFLRAAPPTTLEGIARYLGSGMIRGIGPVYGAKLVRAFGENEPPWPAIDTEKAIPWVEAKVGLALADSQREALRLALYFKMRDPPSDRSIRGPPVSAM